MISKKKLFAFALMVLLLLQFTCGFSASAASEISPYEKIDDHLPELMSATPDSETISVVIWMDDVEHKEIEDEANAHRYERINAVLASAPPTEYATTAENILALSGVSEIVADEADIRNVINEYIIYKRKVHEEAYSTANREKLNAIFPQTETVLFRTVEAEQPKVTYVSMYSPIVLLELTPEQIYRACEADCVTGVYYDASSEDGNYDQMSTAESITGTATLRENKGLDGTGIKIGMIENGVPTPNSTYFDTSKITYDEMLLTIDNTVNMNYVTAHASILVGKNDGLVPNAE